MYYVPRKPHERIQWGCFPEPGESLRFPPKDAPASARDVASGSAIFSLEAEQVRVCPLPKLPAKARWVTLKDYPFARRTITSDMRTVETKIEYEQAGHIWQAEEVLVDGEWKRYYGFVGRYCIAKVPAEEIELAADAQK